MKRSMRSFSVSSIMPHRPTIKVSRLAVSEASVRCSILFIFQAFKARYITQFPQCLSTSGRRFRFDILTFSLIDGFIAAAIDDTPSMRSGRLCFLRFQIGTTQRVKASRPVSAPAQNGRALVFGDDDDDAFNFSLDIMRGFGILQRYAISRFDFSFLCDIGHTSSPFPLFHASPRSALFRTPHIWCADDHALPS